jgi:hypothetical protein
MNRTPGRESKGRERRMSSVWLSLSFSEKNWVGATLLVAIPLDDNNHKH